MQEPRREVEVEARGGRVRAGVLGVRGRVEMRVGCKGSHATQWK